MGKKKAAARPKAGLEERDRERKSRARLAELERKRKTLAKAGIEHDERTAAGRRDLHVVSLGSSLRASVNHFQACFKRKTDRTDARILAWSKFDEHAHRAHAGEIASPRYEAGVDSSTLPGVADSRLEALRDDAVLRSILGVDMHDLLTFVIYHQRTFKEVADLGDWDERAVSQVFKVALDRAAFFWRIGEENKFGRQANRILRRLDDRDKCEENAQ